jgi:hypothetical protein
MKRKHTLIVTAGLLIAVVVLNMRLNTQKTNVSAGICAS